MTHVLESVNRAYHERVKRILPGGVHYNFNMPWEEVPLHFVNGSRSRLFDMDGNEYLDLYARFGAMILGHAHEEYLAALEGGDEGALRQPLRLRRRRARLMNAHIPSAEMIRFGLSGHRDPADRPAPGAAPSRDTTGS